MSSFLGGGGGGSGFSPATFLNLGNVSGATTITASAANVQELTLTGNTTLSFTGWPLAGTYGEVKLEIFNGNQIGTPDFPFTLTWPTIDWQDGIPGAPPVQYVTGDGPLWVTVWTTDGGVTLSAASGDWNNPPILTTNRTIYLRTQPTVVTISIASPAVVSWTTHGLSINDPVIFSLPLSRKHCIMTSANPGVVTTQTPSFAATAHGFAAGDPIQFTTTGALPTNVVIGTTYWVANDANLTANTFDFSDTQAHALAGTNQINTTAGTQSGFHFVWRASTLPTGVFEGGIYHVSANNFTANSFQFAPGLSGGSDVNTSGSTFGPIWAQTGNDLNDGTAQTRANALLSLQAGWNMAVMGITNSGQSGPIGPAFPPTFNLNNTTTLVQLADGTYINVYAPGPAHAVTDRFTGSWNGIGTVQFQGNLSDIDAVVVNGNIGPDNIAHGDSFFLQNQFPAGGVLFFRFICAFCPQYTFINAFPFGPFLPILPGGSQPQIWYRNMSWDGLVAGSDPYCFNQGQTQAFINSEHRIFAGSISQWMEFDGGGQTNSSQWADFNAATAYFCNNPSFPSGIFGLFTYSHLNLNGQGNFYGTVNGPKAGVTGAAGYDFATVSLFEIHYQGNSYLPGTAPTVGLGARYELEVVDPSFSFIVAEDIFGVQTVQFPSIALFKSSITLVNGLNSNISQLSQFLKITGPSAGFSIGGFTGYGGAGANTFQPPFDGTQLTVYNTTTQTMTVVNQDASSTAANRIITNTGANVVVPGPGFVQLIYDGDVSRWIVLAA